MEKNKDDLFKKDIAKIGIFKKNDILLTAVLLVVAACLIFITKGGFKGIFFENAAYENAASGQSAELRAVISVDGEDVLSVALSDDPEYARNSLELISAPSDTKIKNEECDDRGFSFELSSSLGSNSFLVSGGGISCIKADCPDRVCMNEGLISYDTETIVCLPHRLIVRVEPY